MTEELVASISALVAEMREDRRKNAKLEEDLRQTVSRLVVTIERYLASDERVRKQASRVVTAYEKAQTEKAKQKTPRPAAKSKKKNR